MKQRSQKMGEWKKLASKFRRVREGCPQPTIVAVLSIQKFSNFALYVINKSSAATRAISATSENTSDINP